MISIIIPVYNTEKYVERCVGSILSQSFRDFEVILVDDGSTDKSGEICKRLSSQNNKIKYYYKANGGAASARKYGVEQATGEWIMFADSDDTFCEEGICALASLLSDDYDIVIGSLSLNFKKNFIHKIGSGQYSKDEYISSLLEGSTSIGPVGKLFRKELFNNINWETPKVIYQNEDLLMLLHIAVNVKNHIYIDNNKVCYNYIYRAQSASKAKIMPFDNWIILFSLIEKTLSDYMYMDSIRYAFFVYRLKTIKSIILSGRKFDSNHRYIINIINESKSYSLSIEEHRLLVYMKHRWIRLIIYQIYRIQSCTKKIVKSMFYEKCQQYS